MSQTLCKIEVFPAFALPMISTLNWIFATCEPGGTGDRARDDDGAGDGGDGAGAGAGAGDRAGDGAGAGVGGDGTGAAARVGAGAGDRAGDDAGAGDGAGDGTKQQILWFAPMTRKCCEKDWATCVDHSSELLYTQYSTDIS